MQSPSLKAMLLQRAAHTGTPLNGTFELTPRCNLQCKMCYIRKGAGDECALKQEKTASEWIALAKECTRQGMLFLLLTGGEPFLRPDFQEIYTHLKELGLFLSVNTNGTLVNEDTVEWLQKDPPTAVNLTLYGASNQTYQSLCGVNHGFDKAMHAITLLQKADIPVVLNMSFSKANVEDLDKMIALGKSLRLPIRVATYMFPPIRRDGAISPVRFSPEECAQAQLRSMKAQLSPEAFAKMVSDVQAGSFSPVPMEECARIPDSPMSCMAGRSAFWVTWDGRMTPCGLMNTPVADPFAHGFSHAWKSITAQTAVIRTPGACDNCSAKKLCRPCAAIAMAETGKTTEAPAYLCRSTEAFLKKVNEASV